MSQKDCSTSLKEEWALQVSHFHISPDHITVLAGYALVIGFSLGDIPSALLWEVVATFIPLSLAVSPSVSVRQLKHSSWLSQDISLAVCHVIIGSFEHCSIMLITTSILGLHSTSVEEGHTTPNMN